MYRSTRSVVAIVVLIGLGGCAAVKESAHSALSGASDTMHDISEIALELGEGRDAAWLYQLEERVSQACRALVSSAHYLLQGQEIPFDTQLAAALTTAHCREVVQETRARLVVLKQRLPETPHPG